MWIWEIKCSDDNGANEFDYSVPAKNIESAIKKGQRLLKADNKKYLTGSAIDSVTRDSLIDA